MTPSPSETNLSRIRLIGRIGHFLSRLALVVTVLAFAAFALLLLFPAWVGSGAVHLKLDFGPVLLDLGQNRDPLVGFARIWMLGLATLVGSVVVTLFYWSNRVFAFLKRGEVFHAGLGASLRNLGGWTLAFGLVGGGFGAILAGLLLLALGAAIVLAARLNEESAFTI